MWNATGPDSNRKAPPGVVPNYQHPKDIYWTANVALTSVCLVIITFFFFVRVYVKRIISRKTGSEDWNCIVAYIFNVFYFCTIFMTARYGAGYRAWEIRLPEYYNWLKWFYATTLVYIPAAFFTKVTILLLMAHVFAVEHRVSKGIKIFIWALLIAYIPIELIQVFTCTPIRTYWDPNVRNATCLDQRKVFFSRLALSILTDMIILLVPIPLTWKLRMPLRKKIKIILLLGAGGVATALTIYRAYKVSGFLKSDDITLDYTPISMLTVLELTIGFVCACLPAMNLLIDHRIRKYRRRREMRRNPRKPHFPHPPLKRHFWWLSSSTEPTGPSRPSQAHFNSPRMIDLDVEVALETGQAVRIRSEMEGSSESLSCRPLDHRLNSGDGRREGWLSQSQCNSDDCKDTKIIMDMVQSSQRWANQGDKESWCPVWDGPRDPLSSSKSWQPSLRRS